MVQIDRSKWIVMIGIAAAIAAHDYVGAQGGGASNQPTSTGTSAPPGSRTVNNSDKTFLTHAAQNGEAEIELGKMAQAKAADAKVKEYGARMQKDHGNANAQLRAIIAKKGLAIPGGPGPHLALKNRLEKLQGATFDEAYMKAMVDDHTKAVREFETAAKSSDTDIQAFVAKTLPTLREHRQMAQDVYKVVSSTMRSSTTAPATTGPTAGAASGTSGAATTPAQEKKNPSVTPSGAR